MDACSAALSVITRPHEDGVQALAPWTNRFLRSFFMSDNPPIWRQKRHFVKITLSLAKSDTLSRAEWTKSDTSVGYKRVYRHFSR